MTPPMSPPEVDPRIERSRAVILEATLDELADVGYGAFTVEGVARRAGVSKATIYRHWDGKLELVADAVGRLKHAVQPPDTGDHRERIAGLLRGIAEMLAGSRFASCVPAVISAAQRDEGLRDFHHSSSAERRKFMVGMLDAARDAGHLDATIDTNLLAELLVAPIFFRRLMTPTPFPPSEVDRLLELVLDPHWH
jgi:TetR/AcrR family transcriptional regulator, regulator of autoinduction and epiphytic fitness